MLFRSHVEKVIHDKDFFGNPVQYGTINDAHNIFVFISSGVVEQDNYVLPDDGMSDFFLTQTSYTQLEADHFSTKTEKWPSLSNMGKAVALMKEVYDRMIYSPGATSYATLAREAYSEKKGVCQDYSHILIGLCRQNGIPARYINGFIKGTGETHAWIEIFSGDKWYGLDPTNNKIIDYGYIKIGHGRDASDCPVNRGVFTGNAIQTTEIRVSVFSK